MAILHYILYSTLKRHDQLFSSTVAGDHVLIPTLSYQQRPGCHEKIHSPLILGHVVCAGFPTVWVSHQITFCYLESSAYRKPGF